MAPGGTTTTRTIYAGTGEGFSNIDAIRGAGLYTTTNSGASWTQIATGAAMSYYINRIVVDPTDANYVYVATNDGLFRSTNGGTSWTALTSGNGLNGTSLNWSSTAGVGMLANTYNLTSYAGQANLKIRFRLTSDASVQTDGIALDDIAVTAN